MRTGHLFIVTSIIALVAFGNIALAEETRTASTTRNQIKDIRKEQLEKQKEMREETKNRIDTLRDEAKDRRENASTSRATTTREERKENRVDERMQRQREIIKAHFTKMMRRLDAAVLRLEKLAARMDTRIDKLTAKGVDMTKAKEKMTIARGKIADAKQAIADARTAADALVNSEKPKELFGDIRKLIKKAEQTVKDAHRALVEALREIKASAGLRDGDDDHGSSTPKRGNDNGTSTDNDSNN